TDTAAVTGRLTEKWGKNETRYRFTHLWVKRQGRWQLAIEQWTKLDTMRRDEEQLPMKGVVEDGGYALSSDGRGPYINGADSSQVFTQNAFTILTGPHFGQLQDKPYSGSLPKVRSLMLDLSNPV